jgi:ribosomal subunit interface protein
MNTTLTVRHLENNDIIKGHFDERAERLKKHLEGFKDDLVYLHGTLEKNPHKEEFYATLSLFLPSIALHCREQGEDFGAAINTAFSDIARQVEKHIDKLNREKRRKIR